MLAWVLNLGFAAGGAVTPVIPPATTAGGGRRYSRPLMYAPTISSEREIHLDEIKRQIREATERKTEELIERERLESRQQIEEARRRARQAALLELSVRTAQDTQRKLLSLSVENQIAAELKKNLAEEQNAVIAILMASETYEA